jgi:hypothetical protein
MSLIELSVFGCAIRAECTDEKAESLLNNIYFSFKRPVKHPHISYLCARDKKSDRLLIERIGACPKIAHDDSEFLHLFEKDVTVETQKLRPDLYFVHAAALVLEGHALALVAPAGHGKSTTAWGLLHRELKYLSDELAPIDLTKLEVHPFPHALCLKGLPPADYPLPKTTIYTARTAHVPADCLPSETTLEMMPLKAIFFLRFNAAISRPALKPVGKAEATVRLFTNALNPLAHSGEGLDAAIEVVSRVRCFELVSSDLQLTSELIRSAFLKNISGRN